MSQQINLFTLLPKRLRFELTRELVITSYIVFTMILLLIYFIQIVIEFNLSRELNLISSQTVVIQKQFDDLNTKYPINDVPTLTKLLDSLETQLEHKLNAINMLLPNAVFSSYLLALANTDVPGVWLTEIKINNVTQQVDLNGLAVQSESVEQFLSQISMQPVFKNKMTFQLAKLSDTTTPASFRITNKIANESPTS